VRKVYKLRERLEGVRDTRREPRVPTALIAAAVFFCGLLRIRSFNALEPKLGEKTFLRLVGAPPEPKSLCCADTISRTLRRMELHTVRALAVGILARAERNKVFREGWHGALRYVAIDGWEPFSSDQRHCAQCLVRRVKQKDRNGKPVEHEQYYHRYAVAMLIGERFDLLLDFEPLLPNDLRPSAATNKGEDEGELTAARRLLRRVKQTFPWLDVVVADALYANGPFLTDVQNLRMGAVVIARKESDEPLREALAIWGNEAAHEVIVDRKAGERIELWDCRQLETLMTYRGAIRVVRGRVTKLGSTTLPARTWCVLATGRAARLPSGQVLAVARARWHIENTGFHQWTTRWRFNHVFVYDAGGLHVLYWLFFAAFNLLTLFLYLQVRAYGRDRGRDVTRTISRLVDLMLDDLACLDCSPWDTS
jgi:hypothetical protein